MSTTSYGSSITKPTALQESKLGARRHTDDHASEWVYIQAGEAIDAGDLVSVGVASRYVGTVATSALVRSRVLGVAETAIPSGYYGWVKRKGETVGVANGTFTAGDTVAGAAAGSVASTAVGSLTAAGSNSVLGHALATVATTLPCTWYIDLN